MPSFLSPLLRSSPDRFHLRNARTGTIVAGCLQLAVDSKTRNVGLLHHRSLPETTALIIAPTNAIHTFFMKFAIDVAFVAKDGHVVKVCAALPAWRLAGAFRAHAVVEMTAGALTRSGTTTGDLLEVVPNSSSTV